jgi:hypothetical protein
MSQAVATEHERFQAFPATTGNSLRQDRDMEAAQNTGGGKKEWASNALTLQ